MIHIVIETSLPAHTVPEVVALLAPGSLPLGVVGHLEERQNTGLCAGPARGGKGNWVPCWISLRFPDTPTPGLTATLHELRRALVEAARQGGLELHMVPAAVQWGETFHRVRDLEEVLQLPPETG